MTGNRIKWQEITEKVKDILAYFESEGVKATLRAVFYRLVSDNSIPNTVSMYQSLSKHLVKARKEGVISFEALSDSGRYSLDNFGDNWLHRESLEEVKSMCTERIANIDLNAVINDYFNYPDLHLEQPLKGYWAKQPIIPEIWIEKDAIAAIIKSWTFDLHISIRVNKGFGGWSFLYTSIQDIKELLKEHEKVNILYIGDLDPSGVDMDRHLKEVIDHFGMSDKLELKRLALLEDQIDQYHLPPRPMDAATLAKIARDPRSKTYNSTYIVEVDAFLAMAPDAFKELIRSTIEAYHNEAIAEEVAEENRNIEAECNYIRTNAIEQAKAVLLEQITGGGIDNQKYFTKRGDK